MRDPNAEYLIRLHAARSRSANRFVWPDEMPEEDEPELIQHDPASGFTLTEEGHHILLKCKGNTLRRWHWRERSSAESYWVRLMRPDLSSEA